MQNFCFVRRLCARGSQRNDALKESSGKEGREGGKKKKANHGSVLNISGGAEGRSLPPSVSRSVCRPSTRWCFVATFYPR